MEMTDENLLKVAAVYLRAADEGVGPTAAVEKHFGCARSTAGRWVMRARQAGHIPPTTRGVAPTKRWRGPRVVAVAEAVGCDPYDLYLAVLSKANGRLTVT